MDLVSHALAGALVASVGLQSKYGIVASATMVAASLAPDVDNVALVLGPQGFFEYHRHPLTHSMGGAVLLSAALTAVVCLATPLKQPWLVFGISFSGMMLHLLADLLTPWPIPLFYPFSNNTYSLDVIHFFDPFLLAVLAAGTFAAIKWPDKGVLVVAIMLLVVGGYLGFRVYARETAVHLARDGKTTSNVTAVPHGLSPLVWDVIEREDGGYAYCVVDSLSHQVQSCQTIHSSSNGPAVAASRSSPLVQSFLKRSRFPVSFVRQEGDRTTVEWRDVHLMIGGGAIRGVKVVLDGQGQMVEEKYELNTDSRN